MTKFWLLLLVLPALLVAIILTSVMADVAQVNDTTWALKTLADAANPITLHSDLRLNGNNVTNTAADGAPLSRSATTTVCASDANITTQCDLVADGTADQVQIQAALNLGGTVQLSDGNFATSAQLNLNGGNILRGMGTEQTIITFTTTTPNDPAAALKLTSANSVVIENLSIHRAGGHIYKAHIYISKSNRVKLRNLHLEGTAAGAGSGPRFGVLIEGVDGVEGSYNNVLDGVYVQAGQDAIGIRSVDADGVEVGLDGYKAGAITIRDSVVSGCTSDGLYLHGVREIDIWGLDLENCGGYGVNVAETEGILWFGGWLGGNALGGWNVGANVHFIKTVMGYDMQNAPDTSFGFVGSVGGQALQAPFRVNLLSGTFAIGSSGLKTVTVAHGLTYMTGDPLIETPYTPPLESITLTVLENTDVDDWAYSLLKVVSVDGTNVVAAVNVSTASATGAATAKLGVQIDVR